MTMSPDMRAGDEDRDRTIGVIREAFAEGRLTDAEFQDRMGRAQHATTFGDLTALTSDLPPRAPGAPAVSAAAPAARSNDRNWKAAWASWLGVAVVCNVIWGFTWISDRDHVPYYWPFWVMVPWGVAMLIGWLTNRFR